MLILTQKSSRSVISRVCQKIATLSGLEENWDSHGALPPTEEAKRGAEKWARDLFQSDTPNPDVFPVPNGNIQFEWSCCRLDIEIEVISENACDVYFNDLDSGSEWERRCSPTDISDLKAAIDNLTSRSRLMRLAS